MNKTAKTMIAGIAFFLITILMASANPNCVPPHGATIYAPDGIYQVLPGAGGSTFIYGPDGVTTILPNP
jgi:hypothetical protein